MVGALAYFWSALAVFLVWILTAVPGAESEVLILKAVSIIGWLGIGLWTAVQFFGVRWRFVAGPPAAWAWMYAVALLMQGRASLNIGY